MCKASDSGYSVFECREENLCAEIRIENKLLFVLEGGRAGAICLFSKEDCVVLDPRFGPAVSKFPSLFNPSHFTACPSSEGHSFKQVFLTSSLLDLFSML